MRPGSRVVVQGSGALGLFATAVASISGAGPVITVGALSFIAASRADLLRLRDSRMAQAQG